MNSFQSPVAQVEDINALKPGKPGASAFESLKSFWEKPSKDLHVQEIVPEEEIEP